MFYCRLDKYDVRKAIDNDKNNGDDLKIVAKVIVESLNTKIYSLPESMLRPTTTVL